MTAPSKDWPMRLVYIYSSWMLHVKRGGTYVDDPFVLLGRGRWGLYGDHIISEVY